MHYIFYRNDPRYVNAWLHLAETDGDDATFKYMENNGIGNKCASFYSAWANLYEKSGKMQIPIQIYNQGEECMAEPKELFSKLKRYFSFFRWCKIVHAISSIYKSSEQCA